MSLRSEVPDFPREAPRLRFPDWLVDSVASREAWAAGTAILLVGLRWALSIFLAGTRAHTPFLDGLGVVLTAAVMIALPYWLALRVLRSTPQDSVLFVRPGPPFVEPPEWRPILDHLPGVMRLSPRDRARLGRLMAELMARVRFEAAGGLVMTDSIRATIAAEAALMALNLPRGAFGPLKTVLVYPTTFQQTEVRRLDPHTEDHAGPRLGESWTHGTVVLAWDAVQAGIRDRSDGSNVVFHELAHQLDGAGGVHNGIPTLGSSHRYAAWTAVLESSYARLHRSLRRGRPTVLDPYAGKNPAEFFAVATEMFFERPQALQHAYPEFYAELAGYYRQDPALGREIDRKVPEGEKEAEAPGVPVVPGPPGG